MKSKEKWYQFKKVDKIFGIPAVIFIPAALIVIIAGKLGWVPGDLFITAFALMMAVGGVLSWIGEVTPVLKNIGGKLLLPLLGGTILAKKGILAGAFTTGADLFSKNGFQMFFVAAVVAGSILSTDSKFLRKCVVRYLPVLLISQICAIGFSFVGGLVTGRGFYDAVFMVAAPCMTGGTSGAISTLPALYSSVLGTDQSGIASQLYATAMVGTYLAIIFTIVMKVLAERFPALMGNGNGQLIINDAGSESGKDIKVFEESTSDYGDLVGGIFISVAFMVFGSIIAKFVPQVVYVAWTLIIVILLKIFNVVPENICQSAYCWANFAQKYIVILLVASIGLGSSSGGGMGAALKPSNLIIMALAFLGAILGAALGAKFFGLYRYEASITAAMCACNIGASGDVQMCYVTDRMPLLPYATISTRIGGAMMLIEMSILFPIVARAAGVI